MSGFGSHRLERLLSLLGSEPGDAFAVIDGMRSSAVEALLGDDPAGAICLYADARNAARSAPWLLGLDARRPAIREALWRAWSDEACTIVVSRAAPDALRDHLKRWLRVRTMSNDRRRLDLGRPSVVSAFLKASTAAERAAFAGDIPAVFTRGAEAAVVLQFVLAAEPHRLRVTDLDDGFNVEEVMADVLQEPAAEEEPLRPAPEGGAAARPGFVIRPEQLAAMAELSDVGLVGWSGPEPRISAAQERAIRDEEDRELTRWIGGVLRRDAAEALAGLPQVDEEQRIALAVERGRGHGLSSRRALATFATLMFRIGPDFDTAPLVRRFLDDERLPPDRRVAAALAGMTTDEWLTVQQSCAGSRWPDEEA